MTVFEAQYVACVVCNDTNVIVRHCRIGNIHVKSQPYTVWRLT